MSSGAKHRRDSIPDPATRIPAGLDAVRPESAPPGPGSGAFAAHSLSPPKLTRPQGAGLLIGVAAVGVAAVVGAHTLAGDRAPAFPPSPNASQITVAVRPETAFPLTDPQLRAALTAPPDLGPLADPQRRASCLVGLGYAADLEVLGGRELDVSSRPGVLLLVPGATSDQVAAVAVAPSCNAAHTGLLAETVLSRR